MISFVLEGLLRALRMAQHWLRPSAPLREEVLELKGPEGPMLVSRFGPSGPGPWPSWILLHGVASPGREHTVLVRLARSLASSGAEVFVPGVEAWTQLQLAPHLSEGVITSTLAAIEADPRCTAGPGLMGFSFGGAQALRVAALPETRGRLSCVFCFGGYHDFRAALAFLFEGEFMHEGRRVQMVPDAYGLWIVAINYLLEVPGYAECAPLVEVLRELAVFTGDFQLETWDPRARRKIELCRAKLAPEWHELFDVFVPPEPRAPRLDPALAEALISGMSEVALARDPHLRFPDRLELDLPVFLLHGRDDALSPFTQTLAMREHIVAKDLTVALTGLIAHSESGRPDKPVREVLELARVAARVLAQR